MRSGVFVVEDIESRQADVRDFFLTESNYRWRVLHPCIACRTDSCPGRAARQRQRPSDSQYRYGFRPTPSLRSLLRVRHRGDLPYKIGWVWPPSQTHCSKSAPHVLPLRGRPIVRQTTAAGSGGSLPIVAVQGVYSSKSKDIHNTTATARDSPSIQNGIQMSAFEAMTFCKSDLISLLLDCRSQQQNNVLVI